MSESEADWRSSARAQSLTTFRRKVLTLCAAIPRGKVTTYAELAHALEMKAPRAVGQALRHNPFAPEVPCHRVISSTLGIGGFSGATDPDAPEIARKVRLLREEGVPIEGSPPRLVDRKALHSFSPEDAKNLLAGMSATLSDEEPPAKRQRRSGGFDSPAALRAACRDGTFTGTTCGHCDGFAQANLVILPKSYADDFRRFCELNPKPCPLLDVMEGGSGEPAALAPGADVSRDLPKYTVFRDGERAEEITDASAHRATDSVAFLLGCSFSFEEAMEVAGLPVRHNAEGVNVPMYITNQKTTPAGRFSGPLVVSMRPLTPSQAEEAVRITSQFPRVHGAPVHIGNPEELGIRDLTRPDFGDPVTIHDGEIPVFWACGVTPQCALANAKPPLAITHSPGYMFVADVRNVDLAGADAVP